MNNDDKEYSNGKTAETDEVVFAVNFDQSPFFKFLENSPINMHVYTNGKFVYVNNSMLDRLGYTLEEMLEMNVWDVIHPDYKEKIKEIALARENGVQNLPSIDYKAVSKNGEVGWVNYFSRLTYIEGKTYVIVGSISITERKNAEYELQKSRDMLEERVAQRTIELQEANDTLKQQHDMVMSIVSNINDGVIILNRDKKIDYCNATMEKMLGLTTEELVRKINTDKIRISNISLIDNVIEKQAEFKDEETFVTIGRNELSFLSTGTPIKDIQGRVSKIILVYRPIAEVHRLVNRFSGARARFDFDDILAKSEIMLETIRTAKMASNNSGNILIEGESGTGKEMFAQAIHNRSKFVDGPFVAVNCGAIPRDLIASELFGYVEGAFTGARKGGSPGKFEFAQGGTLFLDEIGDMPFEQQVALLRVLQEKHFTRIGGHKIIPLNVRIICATNKNLFTEMQKGLFRADLYYRLNVIGIHIPPLRERKEEIPLLFKKFLTQVDCGWKDYIDNIDQQVWDILYNHSWPGNIRELQNIAEKIAYITKNYQLRAEDLPRDSLPPFNKGALIAPAFPLLTHEDLKQQVADVESRQIEFLLNKFYGNVSLVAKEMGLTSRTVNRKIKQYKIKRPVLE